MKAPDYYEIEDVKRKDGEVRATFQPPNPSTWEVDSKIGTPTRIGPSVMPRTQYSTKQKVKSVATAVADKASPLAQKAVNWVFTGNTAGVKQPQRAPQTAAKRRQPARKQRIVYVQPRVVYTKPPRQHEEQTDNPAGHMWGWGGSKGKKKSSSGGWGSGWGEK